MRGRMTYRLNKMKSKSTLQMYRSGFRRMWDYAPDRLSKWKIPRPGSWRFNQMGGVMWASPAEYRRNPLSGKRCALVLEIAHERECSKDNLKLMRKTCSFLFQLDTGTSGENFPDVNAMMKTLDMKQCGSPSKSLLPSRIISPGQLKEVFTKEWEPGCGMSLIRFLQGGLATWDWSVLGARSKADLEKVKQSEDHSFDPEHKCWSTGYLGGRSKLAMQKAGTRPWRAWAICLCPGNLHQPPPEDVEYTFDADGNPSVELNLCTTCPLFAGQLLRRLMPTNFRRYRKWTKEGRFGTSDHGDIVKLSMEWLVHQGVMDPAHPFDSNSGRKAHAHLCQEVDARYHESMHVHGDLEDVFRTHYQPGLPPSGGYKVREQSLDPQVATAALVKFRGFFGRDPVPEPLPPGLTPDSKVLLMLAQNAGLMTKALEVYRGPS